MSAFFIIKKGGNEILGKYKEKLTKVVITEKVSN